MAKRKLKEQRLLLLAHTYISAPREEELDIDLERFIEYGDLGESAPVVMKYNPEVIQQIAESGLFTA